MRHFVDQIGRWGAESQKAAQGLQMPLHEQTKGRVVTCFDLSGEGGIRWWLVGVEESIHL